MCVVFFGEEFLVTDHSMFLTKEVALTCQLQKWPCSNAFSINVFITSKHKSNQGLQHSSRLDQDVMVTFFNCSFHFKLSEARMMKTRLSFSFGGQTLGPGSRHSSRFGQDATVAFSIAISKSGRLKASASVNQDNLLSILCLSSSPLSTVSDCANHAWVTGTSCC